MTPRFTISNALAADLTTIERARGFLDAATLSEQWIRRMSAEALVLEAHHTTHIEGTQLTWDQAQRLMAGESVPEADPDDTRELLNYRRAFDLVAEYLGSGQPITEGLVREIHARLVAGVRGGTADPGRYRRVQNYVANAVTKAVIYTPPPAPAVPGMMAELVGWLNDYGSVHPVLAAGVAQFQLVHIHPFVDGNGRTSRLLSTLCLYRAGYDFKRLFTISAYYDRDRVQFYRTLQSVREQGLDLTPWLEYFVHGLATQMQEVTARGKQVIRLDVLVQQQALNERQAVALGWVLERDKLTIADYARLCPQTNRRTLQRDLKIMVEKCVLAEQGVGETDPNKCYVLAPQQLKEL